MSAAGVLRRRSIATRHTAQGASNSRCARNLSATLSTLKPPEISNIRATRPSSDSSIVYPFSSRKRQHHDERESFVPIDERLILRNAPEQRGRLLSQVDIGVRSGMARSRHRRLDTPFVAQLACGFLDVKALDLGEESKGLLPIEVFVTFDVSVGRS